jgi:zinc D-Ala-D-Ala carboxypeptidase
MSYRVYRQPAPAPVRRIARVIIFAPLVAIAVIAALRAHQLPASMPSTPLTPTDVTRGDHRGALGEPGAPPRSGALGEADGAVPDGTTVFEGDVPGVANLDPDLLAALREAATDAEGDGVEFVVDSGWRSSAYQGHLLQDAVSKYGSEEEAARWVATPATSPHVSGDAVDLSSDAAEWLSEHGADYGLCQIYANEPWHYELHPEAVSEGCPAMYADPTHDPRMEQ